MARKKGKRLWRVGVGCEGKRFVGSGASVL